MKIKAATITILALLASRVVVTGGAAAQLEPCRLADSFSSAMHCKMQVFGDRGPHSYGLEALIAPTHHVFHANSSLDEMHYYWANANVKGLHTAEDQEDFIAEFAQQMLKVVLNENRLIKSGFYQKVLAHHHQIQLSRQGRGVADTLLTVAHYIGPVTSAIKELPGIVKAFKKGDYNPLRNDTLKVYNSPTIHPDTVDDVADTVNTVGLLLAKAGVPGEDIWKHAAEVVASIGHLFF